MATGKENFENFLRKEGESTVSMNDIDRKNRISVWVNYIEALYKSTEDWLTEYKSSGLVNILYNIEDRYEERVGLYEVRKMTIEVANDIVSLNPIGTILIGSIGRIDLVGRKDTIRFVLLNKDVNMFSRVSKIDKIELNEQNNMRNLVWKITSNPPIIRYHELNQDTFLQCLLKVING